MKASFALLALATAGFAQGHVLPRNNDGSSSSSSSSNMTAAVQWSISNVTNGGFCVTAQQYCFGDVCKDASTMFLPLISDDLAQPTVYNADGSAAGNSTTTDGSDSSSSSDSDATAAPANMTACYTLDYVPFMLSGGLDTLAKYFYYTPGDNFLSLPESMNLTIRIN